MSFSAKLLIGCFIVAITSMNTTGLAAVDPADLRVQCSQEAESYGFVAEQLEEYVDGCILSRGGSPSSAPEQTASIEAQCRQEANDYAIAPEQQTEYINGCILSLGGTVAVEPVAEEDQAAPDPAAVDMGAQEVLEDPVEVQ